MCMLYYLQCTEVSEKNYETFIVKLRQGRARDGPVSHNKVTIGHLRVTIGYLKATVVHIRVTLGHLRVTIGHLWVTIGYFFL